MNDDLVERLRTRAHIRRTIRAKESQFKAENDRIADLCEEAANRIEELEREYIAALSEGFPDFENML